MSGEVVKWSACLNASCSSHAAGRKVAIKLNRSERAYGRCDDCGINFKFNTDSGSKKFLTALGIGSAAPSPAPVPLPEPETPPPTPEKKKGGWL